MKKENSQLIINLFFKELENDFFVLVDLNKYEGSLHDFIDFLLDKGLINNASLRRFVLFEEVLRHTKNGGLPRTKAVKMLAEKFNVSERLIWAVIREHKKGQKNPV
ncbi:MAG: hypothetical protein AAF502_13055 [Bacteroidota bacterium]